MQPADEAKVRRSSVNHEDLENDPGEADTLSLFAPEERRPSHSRCAKQAEVKVQTSHHVVKNSSSCRKRNVGKCCGLHASSTLGLWEGKREGRIGWWGESCRVG